MSLAKVHSSSGPTCQPSSFHILLLSVGAYANPIMLFTQEPSAACGHFQEWRGQCLFDYSCVGVGAVSTRGFVDSLQLPVTCKHVAPGPASHNREARKTDVHTFSTADELIDSSSRKLPPPGSVPSCGDSVEGACQSDLCCPDTGLSPEKSERAGGTSNRDDVSTALDWVRLGRSNFLLPSMRGGMSPQTPAPTCTAKRHVNVSLRRWPAKHVSSLLTTSTQLWIGFALPQPWYSRIFRTFI